MRARSTRLRLLGVALVLAGCAGGGDGRGDGGAGSCTNDLQCDDTYACTIDTCGVGNTCVYEAISERCEMGQTCEVGRGCVSTSSCASNDDCDDGFACTTDTCGVGGICNHNTVDERCAMGEVCDVDMGCIEPPGCSSAAECDDGVDCTNDSCGVDRTCTNTPLNELCDMAAGERCNEVRGCFVPMPCTEDTDCDDGNFCNGAEVCDPEFGCEPAAMARVCDDSEDCTIDACDTDLDMCVFTCDESRAECMCPTEPPTCAGSFSLTGPMTSYTCSSILGMPVVNIDFSTITMTNDGGILSIRMAAQHFSSPLTDNTDPVCPSFDASFVVPGGCEETYRITGTFSDADRFSGMVSATFRDTDGSCGLTGCVNQNLMVSGTRM